jgi:hypothetical protein
MKYKSIFISDVHLGTRDCQAEKYVTSEDFFLSQEYDVKKFKLVNHYFGQDNRRFKKMGYFGMAWYLIKNFWNRNNEKHWSNIDYSKYWK